MHLVQYKYKKRWCVHVNSHGAQYQTSSVKRNNLVLRQYYTCSLWKRTHHFNLSPINCKRILPHDLKQNLHVCQTYLYYLINTEYIICHKFYSYPTLILVKISEIQGTLWQIRNGSTVRRPIGLTISRFRRHHIASATDWTFDEKKSLSAVLRQCLDRFDDAPKTSKVIFPFSCLSFRILHFHADILKTKCTIRISALQHLSRHKHKRLIIFRFLNDQTYFDTYCSIVIHHHLVCNTF